MAEDIVRTGIQIDIDTANAVGQLRALEQQISLFNSRIVSTNDAMRTALSANSKILQQQIGDIGQFSTQVRTMQTSVGRFSTSLEKGKLSFGEYFRYGLASTKTFGKNFGRELDIINATAEDRVKRLSTRLVALGREVDGTQRVLAIRPEILPEGMGTELAIAAQKQQIFNQLLRQGSTHLVNWGKNTQWAGRQLMVGFTIPLTIFGGLASQVFMDLERQAINFRRVYGDAFTPAGETDAMLEEVKTLSVEFTKYGISASETMDMAAKAAATGAQGADLLAATTEATRLATLGQIDQQQALDATIALQSAFGLSATELAESVNFLNAVENQTVVSLNDVTQAIPRAATVIQGLGGDVQDLAAFLAAMRENGVNAAEGANALKSGLASLINPTKQAREQLEAVGIDINTIIETNRGDLMGTVQAFAQAVNALDPLTRQQTLAQVFGKYQFARLGALFENIVKDGSQASRVLQLMGDDVSSLAALADKELGTIEDAIGVKFQGAVERLKIAIAPIGEIFLRIATPIIDAATKVLEVFNSMPDAVKIAVTAIVAVLGGIAPVFLMGVGLIGNGLGNLIKGFDVLRNLYQRMTGKVVGENGALAQSFGFMTNAELDAAAASQNLESNLAGLTGAALINKDAIDGLTGAYIRFAGAMGQAAAVRPQGIATAPARGPRRMASGGFVGGKGNKDSEPTLLMPGEFVVTKEATEKYAPILVAMNQGTLKGYADGTPEEAVPARRRFLPEPTSPDVFQSNRALYEFGHTAGFAANSLKGTVTSLVETADRIRALGDGASETDLAFLDLLDTVLDSEKTFVKMEQAADGTWRATETATKSLKELSLEAESAASLGQYSGGRITSGTRNQALANIEVDEPISFADLRIAAQAAEVKLTDLSNGIGSMAPEYQYILQSVIDEYHELDGNLQAQSRYLLDNAQAIMRDQLMLGEKMGAEEALSTSLELRQQLEQDLIRSGAMLNGEIIDSARAQQVVQAMLVRQAKAIALASDAGAARRTAMGETDVKAPGGGSRVSIEQPKPDGRLKIFGGGATRVSVAQKLQESGVTIADDFARYLIPSLERGVETGIQAASPPPWSIQLGEWIAEGIQIGVKSQSERFTTAYPSMPINRMQPDPQIAANMQSLRIRTAEPTGPMPTVLKVDPQITKNLEDLGLSSGKAAMASEKDTVATNEEAVAHAKNAQAINEETAVKKKGSGGLMKMLYAVDGLSLAMSFLPGPLGEIANKVFIASAALSALSAFIQIDLVRGALTKLIGALDLTAAKMLLGAAASGGAAAASAGLGYAATAGAIGAGAGAGSKFGMQGLKVAAQQVKVANAVGRAGVEIGKFGAILNKVKLPLQVFGRFLANILPRLALVVRGLITGATAVVNIVPGFGQIASIILAIVTTLVSFKFAYDHTGNQIKDLGNAARFAGDEIQSLADRFGFTPTGRTGINEPTVIGASTRSQESIDLATQARAAVQEDEALRQRAETVGRASDINAEAVFRSMFADLLDQGVSRDVAVSIVAAVAEEAGKQNIFVPVRAELEASFNDEGQIADFADFMSSQLAPAVQGVNQDLAALKRTGMGGIVDEGALSDARRWFAITEMLPDSIKQAIIPQYQQKKAIMATASSMEILGTSVSTNIGLLNSEFAAGKITTDQFNSGIAGIKSQLDTLPQAQGLQVMQQQLIALYPELQSNITGIKDAELAFQLLQGAAMGVDMSGFIAQLSAAGATASQVADQVSSVVDLMGQISGVQGQIAELEGQKAAAKAQERSAVDPKDTGGSGGSKDPFAAREDELRDEQARITIKEIKIDRRAEGMLEDELQERFGDTSITVGGITIDMKSFNDVENAIDLIGEQIEDIERGELKAFEDQIEAINDEIQVYQDELDTINHDIELQEQAIRRIEEEYQPILDALDDQKQAQEDILQNLEDQREAAIRPYEDQIAILEKQMRIAEEAAKPRLEALDNEEKALDVQTKALDEQIDYIDEQRDALSEVSKLNESIARQQKNRLGLTQALAEGDIYAATAAANQMKQDAAEQAAEAQQNAFDEQQKSLEDQKDLIEKRRDAINDERDAIEEGLNSIQKQIDAQEYQKFLVEDTYRLSIRAAQDSIDATDREIERQTRLKDARIEPYQQIIDNYAPRMDAINNAIYDKEKEIGRIQKENIKPLEDRIGELEDQRDLLDDIVGDVQSEIARDKAALARRKEYLDQELQILGARREIADLETGGGGGGGQAAVVKWTKEDEAELQKLQDKINELNRQLAEALMPPKEGPSWWESVITTIQGAWGRFTGWFYKNVIEPISAWWTQISTSFDENVIQPIKNAWTSITTWFDQNIIQPIKDAWTSITTWFDQNIIQPIKNAWNTISENIKAVGETFRALFVAIGQLFNELVIIPLREKWNAWFAENIQPKIDWFGNAWETIKTKFNEFIENIKLTWNTFYAENIEPKINWIKDAWALIKIKFGEFIAGIQLVWNTFFTTYIEPKINALRDIWETIKGKFNDFVNGIRDYWNTFWNTSIQPKIDAIVNVWESVKQAFITKFSEIGTWWDEWKKLTFDQKVEAMKTGLKSLFDPETWRGWMENAVDGIVQAWKKLNLSITVPDVFPFNLIPGAAGTVISLGTQGFRMQYAGGMVEPMARGGFIGGDGTRDSVPTMLTPGEFVIRKAMVDKYGSPMFESINQGGFTMPKYNVTKSTAGNVSVKTENNTSLIAPMYNNYSVNVSVSNTNASADEIANKTIMKIRQMQNMQIRSSRG